MDRTVDQDIRTRKGELLAYYRSRAAELVSDVKRQYAESEFKKRAAELNKGIIDARSTLLKTIIQKAKKESWDPTHLLEGVLLTTYTNYVVMMEARNEVWPYEYMAFSRRIGELWEPFCQLCWDYPINQELSFFVPPLFKDVRKKLSQELDDFISSLNISEEDRKELRRYYQKIWTLVTSGEIKLELDLHFEDTSGKYVVDFKSGFSSNEKGNTNRLLLVASVYKILEEGHQCILLVRSAEDRNNHYLQTLKKSELWAVYCGEDAYDRISHYTHFDLAGWLEANVHWQDDFAPTMYKHLESNDLLQYLEW